MLVITTAIGAAHAWMAALASLLEDRPQSLLDHFKERSILKEAVGSDTRIWTLSRISHDCFCHHDHNQYKLGGGQVLPVTPGIAVTRAAAHFHMALLMFTTSNSIYQLPTLETALQTHPLICGVHDACKSVLMISAEDFNRLVQSIEQDGLLDPVRINRDGVLLDGRCRLCALHVLGIPISEDEIETSDLDPWKVASSNEARRHLTKGQKNMVAAKRLEAERKAGRKRQSEGAKKANKRRTNPVATDSVATGRNAPVLDTVAKSEGLSREELRLAELLCKNKPELAKQVENGEMDWNTAIETCGLKAPKPKRAKKKPKSARREERNAKPSERPVASGLSPDELSTLRHLSDQLCKQAASNELPKVIRDYLRECDAEDRPDYHPSMEEMAVYCQCDNDLLHDVAWAEHDELDFNTVGVILALAGVYPACNAVSLTETRITRAEKAAKWLEIDPDNDVQLLTHLTRGIVSQIGTCQQWAGNGGANALKSTPGS